MRSILNYSLKVYFYTFSVLMAFSTVYLFAEALTGALKEFQSGKVVSAAEINANFTTIQSTLAGMNSPPVGTIVAWHKNLAGTPSIPEGWVECNGQTLTDPATVYNGQTIPNLNGQGKFLRGTSGTSGTMETDAFQGHGHTVIGGGYAGSPGGAFTGINNGLGPADTVGNSTYINTGHGAPRVATETRPTNMHIVWIMRVK